MRIKSNMLALIVVGLLFSSLSMTSAMEMTNQEIMTQVESGSLTAEELINLAKEINTESATRENQWDVVCAIADEFVGDFDNDQPVRLVAEFPGFSRNHMIVKIISNTTITDPEVFISLAREIQQDPLVVTLQSQWNAAYALVGSFVQTKFDDDQAGRLVKALPDFTRNLLIGEIASSIATDDPEIFISLAREINEDSTVASLESQWDAVRSVLNGFLQTDFDEEQGRCLLDFLPHFAEEYATGEITNKNIGRVIQQN